MTCNHYIAIYCKSIYSIVIFMVIRGDTLEYRTYNTSTNIYGDDRRHIAIYIVQIDNSYNSIAIYWWWCLILIILCLDTQMIGKRIQMSFKVQYDTLTKWMMKSTMNSLRVWKSEHRIALESLYVQPIWPKVLWCLLFYGVNDL